MKTHTIVSRCQYMILDGVKPSSILVFTFTKKAALELRDRIQTAVGEHAAKEMMICTYHSFCGKLLRHFAEYVGRNHNFSIYDEDDKKSVLAPICKKHSNFKYSDACEYISHFKMQNITASMAIKEKYDTGFAAVAARIYKEYDDVMSRCNAFDFDDLVFKAYLLLKISKEAQDFVHKKYKYVIADENQDSSLQNLEFSLMLRGDNGNLCLVGDLDQSIYSFRGAMPEEVLRTISGPEFKKVILGRNYRSTQIIVNASSQVIKKNKMRNDKHLLTENEQGDQIQIKRFKSTPEEARSIAYKIRELHETQGIDYKDIAILVRLQWHTRELERNLLFLEIPYQLKGLLPFYSRKEIKDLTSYLRLIANPDDMDAFCRVISVPKRNIGNVSVEKILEKARQSTTPCDIISAYKGLHFTTKIFNSFKEFEALIVSLRATAYQNIGELLSAIVEKTNYFQYLNNEYPSAIDYHERKANVEELIRFCSRYENLTDFLDNFVIDPEEKPEEKPAQGVNIMTMHGAKGLEFNTVFMFSVNDNVVPFIRSQDSPGGIEEERRLFYVAMTRAKKRLYISYASQYGTKGSMGQAAFASRFINEIPSQYKRYA